ncbi:Dolichyl-phosphate-mannose-protein mannosyltransferase [Ruminococcus sp. YE71]|uniref:ArnT family glycosyltransferase n=1 Tax=unclassified Ruminococcus TaxID=2608920 RepID=UPI0008851457|nr:MULTISPECIES: glycosyltransferase family 39 protein [unclassified Ruminococcus]SDA16899.1 Dolichyl-phosphate-mannose-protein mannosyltransferase [Ruminococcus sp. YE78]SFW25779.1 Dolichyl-phosphate-mannose-protein mannosyltransferase [Ruminococcus sp. YE71]
MSRNPDREPLGIKPSVTDKLIRAVAAHPYLCALLLCLGLNPFYLGAAENVPQNALYAEVLMVLTAGFGCITYVCRKREVIKPIQYSLYVLFFLVICVTTRMYAQSESKGIWMFVAGFALLLMFYSFAMTKRFKEQLLSLLIIGTGFLLKFYYVYYSSCYTRQNDVHRFGGDNGHAGYMEYLLFNKKLPDFDVREVWQFCHPPLHHFICALWIGVNENVLGVGHNPARESLQTLSLFYTTVIMITAYKIFRHFKLKGLAMYVPLAVVSFHPCFVLMSGAINNDVLSVAFAMFAFYQTLKWYEDPKMSTIMKIAVCVGCAMMTKLNAALVAPSIAIVFLVVFIRNFKEKGAKLFGQFAAFGAVCIPLGLWFEIKNYIKFKVPIMYVQEMSVNSRQYIGDQPFLKRITDFSKYQFDSVYEQWLGENGESYNEFNPLVTLLKNSLFTESISDNTLGNSPLYHKLAVIFFWLAALIAAACFVMMVYNLFTKSGLDLTMKAMWGSYYALMMLNFYKMSADYPFTCTMNFRYITPTVIIGAFFMGITLKRLEEKRENKAAEAAADVMAAAAVVFCLLSVIIYLQVCVPKTAA